MVTAYTSVLFMVFAIFNVMSTLDKNPLEADLTAVSGEISSDSNPPILTDARVTRAPAGLHVPEQATGASVRLDIGARVKFMNFWTLDAEPGHSLLFTHPLNRDDLPFRTLAELVGSDLFRDDDVHVPALWTAPAFEGVLPAGTPVAQVFAVPRVGQGLEVGVMNADAVARNAKVQRGLAKARGMYREEFRY